MDYMTAETRTQTFARGTQVVKFNRNTKFTQKPYKKNNVPDYNHNKLENIFF